MHTVFITGGLASGKKTVCNLLQERGATVIDLDVIAKEEQEKEAVLAALQAEFGVDIVDADGALNRRILAERAFATPEKADRLNAICWPPVNERLASLLFTDRQDGQGTSTYHDKDERSRLVVVEIPLLAEGSRKDPRMLDRADEVITVEAHEEIRLNRAVERGMDRADAIRRLSLQASDEQRRCIATYIIDNNGNLESLEKQVDDWYTLRTNEQLF